MGDWFYIFETFNLNFYFLAPRLARTLGSWMECGINCKLGKLSLWDTWCLAVWLAGYDVWCRHVWWWRWPGPGNDGGGGRWQPVSWAQGDDGDVDAGNTDTATAGPLHGIIRTRIHIIPMFTTQGAPLEPFSAPQCSCNYWLATVTTGQHVRRQRGHLVTAQVTNPPPGSRSNTTQTSYHIYLELELGTPPFTIDNCKNKSEYYRLAFRSSWYYPCTTMYQVMVFWF